MPALPSSALRRAPLRWGAFAGLVITFVGCALSRDGLLETACTSDAECVSANPCEVGTCTVAGACEFAPSDADPPQLQGDCQQSVCQEGVIAVVPDLDDSPPDEGCITYECGDSGVTEVPLPQGNVCTLPNDAGEGLCDEDGICQDGCGSNGECPQPEGPCQAAVCDLTTGECSFTDLDGAIPQIAGDCEQISCDQGSEDVVVDQTDRPADTECRVYSCTTEGVLEETPLTNQGCGTNDMGVCNDQGQCVGCTTATVVEFCGPDTPCLDRECVSDTCVDTPINEGQNVPGAQTSGDCLRVVCQSGMEQSITDTNDEPPDYSECVAGSCVAATPTPANKASGTMCGNNDVCDGAGNCIDCLVDSDCPNATDWVCNGNNVCKKKLGVTCGGNNQCNSGNCEEGVCCNNGCAGSCRRCDVSGSIGTCSDAMQGMSCGNNQACDNNGNCDAANGQGCSNDGQCASGNCESGTCCSVSCGTCEVCNGMGNACVTASAGTSCGSNGEQCDASGACLKALGDMCSAPAECTSTYCVDMVCCSTMNCTGNHTCDTVQGDGMCRKEAGQGCSNNDECASNNCDIGGSDECQ